MNIEMKKVVDLIPYDRNPRENEEAVAEVVESIKEFGFKVPIVVDSGNVIVAGHTRLKASKRLKMEEVPTIVASDLTDKQIRAFRIADNKTSEKALWNEDLLKDELEELEGMFTGFSDDEIEAMFDDGNKEGLYTDRVDIPQYEPTGKDVSLSDMYDYSKAVALISEIEASTVSEEEKDFLIKGAYRHIVFNYKSIAEYYANADEEVQGLMERSALVIIDYENAIRNGYVSLSEDVKQMIEEDEE